MITCKPHNATFATPATCLARIKLAKKGNGNWGYGGAEDTQQYEACSTCETGRKLMEGIPMEEIKPALKPEKPKTKVCTRCKEEKPISEFHHNPNYKYGVRPQCNECINIKAREYYAVRKARIDTALKKKPLVPGDAEQMYLLRHINSLLCDVLSHEALTSPY